MSTVISIENLSKKYIISHQRQEHYGTLRDALSNGVTRLADTLNPFSASRRNSVHEEFWALKDISFEIRQGDRVGIIGRNGAGKSTLLKLLSRITKPTSGRIMINGRVASLLEVGTGFHPELTGRENIYLNGAILGMSRTEIAHRFDEIVAFSEVEQFLDTPVKRYSSGMYVRLAFSVAAHLDPEILIVDEVLAVGDAQFQNKCLGKMDTAGQEGRTVLFVSHNMQAIKQLCPRSILLCAGRVEVDATSSTAIQSYIHGIQSAEAGKTIEELIEKLPADPAFKLTGINLSQDENLISTLVDSGKQIKLEIKYEIFHDIAGLRIYFDLFDDNGNLLFRSFHDEDHDYPKTVKRGNYSSIAIIPENFLGPVQYELRIRSGIYNVRSCLPEPGIRIPIKVELTGRYNRAYSGDTFRGKIAPVLDWVTKTND